MFRNQKRSLQNSMKPGKRNCGRRKQSAWRGQYCLFPVSVCPTCTSTPSLSSAMSCQCDTTPCSFISCFSPHCAVCLNFFTCLISTALILSFSPSPICRHTLLHKHLSNTLSPPLPTHLWLQSSTMSLSHWCQSLPVVIAQITFCNVVHHHFLSSVCS